MLLDTGKVNIDSRDTECS
ncbi:hypothetical protein TOPH_02941 [Tolypocladium ophioglossoides CBS 100239]|uniref:Uncharacterized protein n=1 Tax=Tolypocladium ophioglossoides (strain CBS 100239) TaxID=1163406 RepID=A0A0L0NEE0_TOLOC|nr:hypothetical protein TOPH_02941 [Tolypocladium ophioglossoides CBS 100239]